MINGIFYVLRRGSPWRDLPSHPGLQPLVEGRGVTAGFRALATGSPQSMHLIELDHPRPSACRWG